MASHHAHLPYVVLNVREVEYQKGKPYEDCQRLGKVMVIYLRYIPKVEVCKVEYRMTPAFGTKSVVLYNSYLVL